MIDRRLLVVSGKGGVGKSALTAAIALRAARTGKQVLAVSMTGGAGLAPHLGMRSLEYTPVKAAPGVWALTIDRATALDEYIRLQMHVPRLAPTAAVIRGFGVFVDTVPGIREVVTIGKVVFEAAQDRWDLVVADAPPTGQLMSYLRAPRVIADLVPAGRVKEQAAWMEGILGDPAGSGLVLVAIPEELPVVETLETLDELAAEPAIGVAAIAYNRVLPPLDLGGRDPAGLAAGPHRDAAVLHLGAREAQQEWLQRLPAGPRVPYLFGLLTPGEVAARLADLWEEA